MNFPAGTTTGSYKKIHIFVDPYILRYLPYWYIYRIKGRNEN